MERSWGPPVSSASPVVARQEGGVGCDSDLDLADFFISDAERLVSEAGEFKTASPTAGQTLDVLAFSAGNEEYAIAIAYVQEIVKLPPITAVPRVPASVLGITSLRGTIIPVLDLRIVLGIKRLPVQRSTRLLVLRGAEQPLAVLVDQVSQVVHLDRTHIEPRPEGVVSRGNRFIECIGRAGPRLLIVLEPVALLSSLEVVE